MVDHGADGGRAVNNPNPDSQPGGNGEEPPQLDGVLDNSNRTMITGCLFGVAFIALGFIGPVAFRSSMTLLPHDVFALMIAMGCGIILAVFGTRAAFRYRGLAITGVGVAVGVVYVLLNPDLLCRFNILEKGCTAPIEAVASGRLVGDFDATKIRSFSMDTTSAPPIMGANDIEGGKIKGYLFEIRQRNLEDPFEQCIRVHIYEDQETVVKVPFEEVERYFNSSKPIAWAYKAAESTIYALADDRKWHAIGLQQTCGSSLPTDRVTMNESRPGRTLAARVSNWLIPSAWAGQDIRAIIESLDNNNANAQTALRSAIVSSDEAVAVAGEWLAEKPDDPERKWQTLRILDGALPQTKDPAAALAVLPDNTKVILAGLIDDQDEKLGSFAVGILSKYAGPDWAGPAVLAFDHASVHHDDLEAIVLQAVYDRLPEADKANFRDNYVSQHAGTAFARTLASLALPSDPTKPVGWAYFGQITEGAWNERVFDIAGGDSKAPPQKGDTIIPNTEVNLREGMIEFVKAIGWVNKPIVEVAKPGQRFKVVETNEVHPGFFWVELARDGN